MAHLPEQLRFIPWHGGDPPGVLGPWIFDQLDKNQLVSVAQAVLDYNRIVLDAQIKLNARMQEVLGGAPRAK